MKRLGKYDVLTLLQRGGMAEVLLGSTTGPGGFRKFVVLKRVLPEAAGDENFVKMFLDEARVTGAFSHPNICQTYELGNDKENGLFVALEFIAGQDLNQVVGACAEQQEILPIGYSAAVVHDCAIALHYAHTFKLPNGESSPVIHRDVAQKNIMVTYDGQVKLLDFGIAKAKGALARTRAGTVKGTAGYMSPEQVRGAALDGRSDVFSLGVVLWEMTTGKRLFSAETEMQELKMILQDEIVPPAEVEASVPPEVSAVVMKALERDVSKRFSSAKEMARALSTTCARWLYDADERAGTMKKLFLSRIASTQRLFDSAGKDAREVNAAVEAYRSSTSEQAAAPTPVPAMKKPGPSLSARRLKPVAARKEEKPPEEDWRPKRDVPRTDEAMPRPVSNSKLWPVLGGVVALAVGGAVWLAMQVEPALEEPAPTGEIPGVELARDPAPDAAVPEDEKPVVNTAPVPTPTQPTGRKEKGEVTLALIPEATVTTRGGQKLAEGTLVSFWLPVGTHLVTVTGPDRVKRSLSLRVTAGKNKAQRFRVDDLPPQ